MIRLTQTWLVKINKCLKEQLIIGWSFFNAVF
jgi:hypothetical protein